MEERNICQSLEDDFTSTFIRELIPGVLHNFANPLNGIMGRSKLLQRRIDDTVKKINEKYPEAASELEEELRRIVNDVRSVNKESESFFEMFRDVSGKFYALAAKGKEPVNLSHLLAAEMRFANFYLDFKHGIKKNIQFDQGIHEFAGNTAELSLVFWRLIRFAMSKALDSALKVFFVETLQENGEAIAVIKYSGDVSLRDQVDMISTYLQGGSGELKGVNLEEGITISLMILKKYSARVSVSCERNLNSIVVAFPTKR
ncbi:MAG: HAMP domain-containing histidine kinase [Deltaproteobacteria bacterium]|nr:HAMP domain-containing histidine kinase [Deltaproteobacteria bacterium]